jgi:hypothetical protein
MLLFTAVTSYCILIFTQAIDASLLFGLSLNPLAIFLLGHLQTGEHSQWLSIGVKDTTHISTNVETCTQIEGVYFFTDRRKNRYDVQGK